MYENSALRGRFELPIPGWRTGSQGTEDLIIAVQKRQLKEYIELQRISGVTTGWISDINSYLNDYLNYISWNITKKTTLEYLSKKIDSVSVSSYRKRVYQIRKLLSYLNVEWSNQLKPPREIVYQPRRITNENIIETIDFFKNHKQYLMLNALIMIGKSSGARAEELYQLKKEDINLLTRTLSINHCPRDNQTTKSKCSRITFFDLDAKRAIENYYNSIDFNNGFNMLFEQRQILKLFKNAPIKVKHLRKYFSQEWDRRCGATSIKKILMGHSLKGDVDLQHYNAQSQEDLKKIYDKVMS